MFAKVATVLALTGLSQAVISITNFNIVGNGTSTISWASSDLDNDPNSFTIELTNPSFHTQFAIGNNVQTTDGKITFETPALEPGPNYGIQFVANNNATDILAMTNPFPIAENDVSSSTVATFSGSTTISAMQGTTSTFASVSNSGASTSAPTPVQTSPSSSGSSSSSTSSGPNPSGSVFNGNGGGSGAMSVSVPAGGVGFVAFVMGLVALAA